ncbi:hypothetical protein, variant [Verruconis gallopava]|nr:hypothetical protein, variant [Verruconis gallopava]KIW09252.1 hypothetical protein, variant [Verruconis gallopava]
MRFWRNVFNVPKNELGLYHELVSAINIPIRFHLNANLGVPKTPEENPLRRIQGNISDLITFNVHPIDQELWERVSAIRLSEDQKLAEVSLLPLVFLFLTHMTTDTFVSESLLSDQDHPEVGPLLLAFVQSSSLLMTGLPRWVPHPTLPAAHITRRNLMKHLNALLDITEDVELQNNLLAARGRMLDDHKAPRSIRTIELLRLLHGMNTPHIIAFWMLLHIISDANLLERIRVEAIKVVDIVQDGPVMGFSVPPRVTLDMSGLLGDKTPLLKRCWLESARLYSRGQGAWTATEDFDLIGQTGGVFSTKSRWKIAKGDWIDAPYWHSNTSASMWEAPEKWNPNRHVEDEGKDLLFDTMVFDTPGLFGMNEAIKPARLFALAFVASAVLLYDFETDPKKGIPDSQFAPGVALPAFDVRVRVRRRVYA